MTAPDILAIAREGERLAREATPGPWRHVECGPHYASVYGPRGAQGPDSEPRIVLDGHDDAAFIAHAGTHYRTLCAAVVEMAGEVERLRAGAREELHAAREASDAAVLAARKEVNALKEQMLDLIHDAEKTIRKAENKNSAYLEAVDLRKKLTAALADAAALRERAERAEAEVERVREDGRETQRAVYDQVEAWISAGRLRGDPDVLELLLPLVAAEPKED